MIKNFTLLLILSFAVNNTFSQYSIEKTLYHEYDKPTLIESSQKDLDELIQHLKQLDVRFVSIKSHTDKKGTNSYNETLSQQRNLYVLQNLQVYLPGDVKYLTDYFGEDSLVTENDLNQARNRRTEIIVWYNKKDESKEVENTMLVPYTEDVDEQHFEIDLNDTVSIIASEGTAIKFPPGSIQNKRNELATGTAVLIIKEYYKPGDILLSGMHSVSDEGLLQTGGMFKVLIVQNKDTMLYKTLKPVQIRMPDINNFSGTMNVFTTDHSDTSFWNDTRQSFRRIASSWNWPLSRDKLQEFDVDEKLPFYSWEIGRKWTEEYYSGNWFVYWGPMNTFRKVSKRPLAKIVRYTITKTDSTTLIVSLHEKFKRRGYKKYNIKTFDTTFAVKYSPAVYETFFTGLNYINCDRFITAPEVTDFYVKTPGFNGAQMLVYFRNLNAFMPAIYEKGKYKINKVPPGEYVYLIAIGKKGDEFYYGKQPFTISKKATANVTMQKIKQDEMKQMLKMLRYKS